MNLPLAPLVAVVLGALAALGAALMPLPMLEELVMGSGLPSVVAQAEPPLGTTARLLLAGGVGALVAAFSWIAGFVVLGTRSLSIGRDAEPVEPEAVATPVLRRADAHPDAPPRPPLLATRDLGEPFLEVRAAPAEAPAPAPAEQPLPLDLDQRLASFDPEAVPEVPIPAPIAFARPKPRPRPEPQRERFEVFELTPPVRRVSPRRPAPVRDEAITRPETDASVHALLERLERGVIQKGLASARPAPRTPREAERGLEEALVTLRNLARRA
jgi:hypothetical protein